ncbi:MAG: hypothetical protein V2J10_08545, partial [Wenzhouxiangella sp.]|nr:hypothetical protein [Wenzhouxiangella sp.]
WNGIAGLRPARPLGNERIPILFGQAELTGMVVQLEASMNEPAQPPRKLHSHGRFRRWLDSGEETGAAGTRGRLRESYRKLEQERQRYNEALRLDEWAETGRLTESLLARARDMAQRLETLLNEIRISLRFGLETRPVEA